MIYMFYMDKIIEEGWRFRPKRQQAYNNKVVALCPPRLMELLFRGRG